MTRECDRRNEAGPATAGASARTPADPAVHDLLTQALSRARAVTEAADFVPDPAVTTTTGGTAVVHLAQQHLGIPVFEGTQTVRFGAAGRRTTETGRPVAAAPVTPAIPKLPVVQAVLWAAGHVAVPHEDEHTGTDEFGAPMRPPGVDVTGFRPEVLAVFTEHPDRPTVLAAGPFGAPIKASLVWFPLRDALVLGWEVLLTMPGFAEQYRTVVGAHDGRVLYCRQLVQSVTGRGNVHAGEAPTTRRLTRFPRPVDEYGLARPPGLPPAFPDPWIATDSTAGNSVRARPAHVDADPGRDGAPLRGVQIDGEVVFDPAPDSLDQDVLDAFARAASMHDALYLLGFTEASGNFQVDVFGRGGIGNDPVEVRCFPGSIAWTATMASAVDGWGAVLRLGRVPGTGRHTARDDTVVFHEYAHGLTNRLVGGPGNARALEQPQSQAMGEGWSDFVACTLTRRTVVGAWAFGRPGGLRRAPYDARYPFHYGTIGAVEGRPHAMGEIWCAALMELARRLGPDSAPTLRLVIDALPLTPANPSFLDGRDAILAVLDDRLDAGSLEPDEHARQVDVAWQVFARLGMGVAAVSPGASVTGVRADFSVPAPPPPGAVPSPVPAGAGGPG